MARFACSFLASTGLPITHSGCGGGAGRCLTFPAIGIMIAPLSSLEVDHPTANVTAYSRLRIAVFVAQHDSENLPSSNCGPRSRILCGVRVRHVILRHAHYEKRQKNPGDHG